jgi:rod shape-determining protein MreC
MRINRKQSSRKWLVIFCLLAAFGLFFFAYASSGWVAQTCLVLTNPLRKLADRTLAGGRFVEGLYASKHDSAMEIEKLKEENRLLAERIVENDSLRSENARLKEIIGDPASPPAGRIMAKVIGKGLAIFGDELIIDRGAKSGISAGDTVVLGSGTLVGRVDSVMQDYSRVQLIGNRSFRAAAKFASRTGGNGFVSGILLGGGLGSLTLEMVASEAVLNEGDIVYTSGMDGLFPPDILVGRVAGVISGPSDFFQKAAVASYADIGLLDVVNVIKRIDIPAD